MTIAQITLAAIDLTLVASVLYVLMPVPKGIEFVPFMGIFLLALVAGNASHVPGGIGVFETVLLLGSQIRDAYSDLGSRARSSKVSIPHERLTAA